MIKNKRFLLIRRPNGMPVAEDFALVNVPLLPPAPDSFTVHNHYASLDPAQRGWMDDAASYMPPIELGSPVRATTDCPGSRHVAFSIFIRALASASTALLCKRA